ncbi:MAG TPA: methylated-DNA--[protein]-cysteine S-methyltransferase [Chloroflexia bacterium]|nr:methylated-DNA--[protein]-cysteine S-methyltransferase [Chloroflexia bacterium]
MAVVAPHIGLPTEVLPIHWGRLDTPLGPVYVAASPAAVVTIGTHDSSAAAFQARLDAELGPRLQLVPGPTPVLAAALEQLAAYFAGRLQRFDVPLDLRLLRGAFNHQVLTELGTVPWGHLVSYSELARRAGAPRAARAVGGACAANPIPILIPCHRVVHAGGGIGGYSGPGIAYKRGLLAIEGVTFPVKA